MINILEMIDWCLDQGMTEEQAEHWVDAMYNTDCDDFVPVKGA